jgi:hypothetical protein
MLGNHGGAAIAKINKKGNQGGELPAVATGGGGETNGKNKGNPCGPGKMVSEGQPWREKGNNQWVAIMLGKRE